MYENIKLMKCGDEYPLGIRFVGETMCDEKFVIARNCSDLTSFEYIVDGYGTLEINGQVLHPKKGDMFFIREGSRHKYYSQRENGWYKYFISFCGPLVDDLIQLYLPGETFLFEGCFIEKNFRRIFDIAFNSEDMHQAQTQLAIEVFKIFNYIRDHQRTDGEDLADKVKRNIENHISSGFNLDSLCADMNYSKNHMINIFSRKYFMTPYQYYIKCKIEMAKDYLTNSNMTISEISDALAYSDQQYFSYSFKKETGYSPQKYRKLTKM